MKKRILSILLVCCMVLTMLPTAAFAAVSDSLGNTPEENQAILDAGAGADSTAAARIRACR